VNNQQDRAADCGTVYCLLRKILVVVIGFKQLAATVTKNVGAGDHTGPGGCSHPPLHGIFLLPFHGFAD